MRRKPGPATHGGELLGLHRGRRGELIDRGVELGLRPTALPAVTFGNLARRDVAPAAQDARTGQRIGQMHIVVPAVPVGLDGGIDFGSHDEKTIRQVGHFRHSSCTRRSGGMECAPTTESKRGWSMRKLLGLVAVAVIASAGVATAQETPRKGGVIRMTAPYAASFSSLDPHTTPRAQDEIVNKAIHRTLYNWDSKDNKLVLELAKSVTPSEDGLTYTFKLRD